MLRLLSSRLTLMLIVLFVSVMGVLVFSTYQSGLLWQDRVNQSLYRGLVTSIGKSMQIDSVTSVDLPEVKSRFRQLVGRDLLLDAYLLSVDGDILQASSNADRNKVDKFALRDFFSDEPDFPIYGTDPGSESANKIFSAAQITDTEGRMGYLYVVVGEERYDSIIDKLLHHNCLKLLSKMGIATGVVVLLLGWILYFSITGPIRRMCLNIDAYEQSDFTDSDILQSSRGSNSADVWYLKQTILRMAEKISEQLQQLQSLDTLRKEQLVQLSHDLKTPIAAQRGYLETLLLADKSIAVEKVRHFQQRALDNTKILSSRVDDILELARLENLAQPFHLEAINISELCIDTVLQLENLGSSCGVELALSAPNRVIEAQADIGQLQRVLINLIENAFHYSAAGGSVELSVAVLSEQRVRICVQDSGQGIHADDLPLLFEPYYRASKEKNTEHQGLGLAICQKIIALHGSRLQVDSIVNQGSKFYFDLDLSAKTS